MFNFFFLHTAVFFGLKTLRTKFSTRTFTFNFHELFNSLSDDLNLMCPQILSGLMWQRATTSSSSFHSCKALLSYHHRHDPKQLPQAVPTDLCLPHEKSALLPPEMSHPWMCNIKTWRHWSPRNLWPIRDKGSWKLFFHLPDGFWKCLWDQRASCT